MRKRVDGSIWQAKCAQDLASQRSSIFMSVLTYGVELWGCAYYNKYLSQIDKLVGRARKYGDILRKVIL